MSARERNRQAQEEKELEKKAKERARQQRMARQYVKADPAAAKEKQAARLFAIPINQWGGASFTATVASLPRPNIRRAVVLTGNVRCVQWETSVNGWTISDTASTSSR
jgi:hypothetical protein